MTGLSEKVPLLYILNTIIFIWWISLVRHLLTEKFLQLFFYVSYQPFIIDHYSYPVIVYALLQIFQRKMSGRPNWAPIPSEIQGCNIEEKNEFKPPNFTDYISVDLPLKSLLILKQRHVFSQKLIYLLFCCRMYNISLIFSQLS